MVRLQLAGEQGKSEAKETRVTQSRTVSSAPGSKISSAWVLRPFLRHCCTLFSVESCFVLVLILLFLIKVNKTTD